MDYIYLSILNHIDYTCPKKKKNPKIVHNFLWGISKLRSNRQVLISNLEDKKHLEPFKMNKKIKK